MKRLVFTWLIVCAALAALVAGVGSHLDVRTDLSFFLPDNDTPETSVLASVLQNTTGGSLVLIGLEGADRETLAKASQDVANALERSGQFNFVANGGLRFPKDLFEQARAWRFLIGPAWESSSFTQEGIEVGVRDALARLASAQGWALRDSFTWDPFDRMGALTQLETASQTPHRQLGVWMDEQGTRAVLMAHARAPGADLSGQEDVRNVINSAVAPWLAAGLRVHSSGTGLFALDSRTRIRSEMRLLSTLATILVFAIIGFAFRRLSIVVALGLPLVAAVFVGAGIVQALFGSIHGVALTFGATLIGVAVDYPIHLYTHQKRGERAQLTAKRLVKPLSLSVATTMAGFLALSPSGFRGLAQLGILAATGVLTASLVTYWVLPRLMGPGNQAKMSDIWGKMSARTGFTRWLKWGLAVGGAGVLFIAMQSSTPLWETSLSNLSAIPQHSKDLDRELRTALHAPDVRHMLVVTGHRSEEVLWQEEALIPALEDLIAKNQLGGYRLAATVLPSQATQRARQAALPDRATLTTRLDAAAAKQGLYSGVFQEFLNEIERQRQRPPIEAPEFLNSSLGWRLAPLLHQTNTDTWNGYVLLSGPLDITALLALGQSTSGVRYTDLKASADRQIEAYRSEAFVWLGFGSLVAFVILILGLKSFSKAVLATLPAASAILLTFVILLALGVPLSLFHILALLLVAGIGVDYALFFNTFRGSEEDQVDSFRAIVLCNMTTISVFSVLALSSTPVLSGIGMTVAIGAALSFLMTYAFGPMKRVVE